MRAAWIAACSPAGAGTMEFEGDPGKPVRIYGNNLGTSAVHPAHGVAERLAERLARANGIRNLVFYQEHSTAILDPEPVDVGTRRVAYYTHLPSGSYVFRVSAADAGGA